MLANLGGFLLGKYFMMSSRWTRNSQSAAPDAVSIAVSAEPSCASVIADPGANPLGPSIAASHAVAAIAVQQDQLSPAFLATVVQAVKNALAADRVPACSVLSASSQPLTATMLGGVPVSSSNLASQASAFLTSGTGILPTSANSASQGSLPPVSSVTPLRADQFALELQHHPDCQLVNYVLDGISNGF